MGISVTDETLQRSGCFLCESVATAANVLSARAKRQQQSAQPERKSTLVLWKSHTLFNIMVYFHRHNNF
ncbi:hypothetical protein [Lysinibacillus sp. fls2-241-R2A-57]|uniref:hypothetical protein n=1 Tax=Lysinibacillus sp. fls2-241-R2A-57 TaxID=3040292 RepID=UPI00255267BA|nr:hypothetical protein [Lysinibacillus sp. fls2-241-R2A-57]